MIYELAKKDRRVLFIGSDLGPDTLINLKKEFPKQFLMEGISEANLVSMAAGLAMEGKIPYVNTIATFLSRRCFEQIVLDMGLHNTNVRLIANGGGMAYAPLGPTHLATDDIAILRTVPNMTIIAPCDADEMRRMMPLTVDYRGPIYIRLGKGGDPIVSSDKVPFEIGRAIPMREGSDALVVTTGVMVKASLDAAEILAKKGIQTAVLHLPTIKPLDIKAILDRAASTAVIVTLEEHTVIGGLGSAVAEVIAEAGFTQPKRFKRLGIPDVFPDQYGSQASLLDRYDLNTARLVSVVEQLHGA
jgi:transketolase